MIRRLAPLALALLVFTAAGCGEKKDVLQPQGSKQVELLLDYFPNADHAGIYAAQAAGDFKQAGLNVKIRQPSDPAAPIKQVAAGRVERAEALLITENDDVGNLQPAEWLGVTELIPDGTTPVTEGGTCGLGSNQDNPVFDKWQFWDGLRRDPTTSTFRSCWWSVEDPAFPPGDVIRTLSEYIAAHPDAAIVNLDGNYGGVQIMHGFSSPSDSYDGWVDGFTIGKDVNQAGGQTDNSTVTYDFQAP